MTRAQAHATLHTAANSLEFQGATLIALVLRDLAKQIRELPAGTWKEEK